MLLTNPRTIVALGCGGVLMVGLSVFVRPTPLLLYNPSPSEPIGFYRASSAAPAPGQLISFKVPEQGRAYAAQHLAYVLRYSILKEIAAGQGSTVCADHAVLSIDGRARAISYPRMLGMYLARKHVGASFSEIGRFFGGRNHSTVISADKKVKSWLLDEQRISLLDGFETTAEILASLECSLGS